ncbi:MAG TPA: DUF2513 domain-containing protein [Thermoanaerobaculia bacterium]|nr:DUF2513 domain-containing protein [Thermoanaerobaculia bacterium]
MKRDMDLARRILFAVEEAPLDGETDLNFDDFSQEEISYHVMLLSEAGLIEAQDQSGYGGSDWQPERLTWAGHEFLDASRDQGRWEKAKKLVREKVGGLTFDALKAVLIRLATEAALH